MRKFTSSQILKTLALGECFVCYHSYMKKILIFHGNSATDTFTHTLADTYESRALDAGYDVRRINIGSLAFDPVLHRGYKEIQQLEPDLIKVQDDIRWADHIVFIYPNWWCAMPALMKGMFDRMWLPGFAFNFDKETGLRTEHLSGKTARVIIVLGTYTPFMAWWKFGDYTNELAHGILGFAGIRTKVTGFGPSQRVDDARRTMWIEEVKKMASKGK